MKGGNLKKGLTEQMPVGQKKPREETKKGQRPLQKKDSMSTDRGKFRCG